MGAGGDLTQPRVKLLRMAPTSGWPSRASALISYHHPPTYYIRTEAKSHICEPAHNTITVLLIIFAHACTRYFHIRAIRRRSKGRGSNTIAWTEEIIVGSNNSARTWRELEASWEHRGGRKGARTTLASSPARRPLFHHGRRRLRHHHHQRNAHMSCIKLRPK